MQLSGRVLGLLFAVGLVCCSTMPGAAAAGSSPEELQQHLDNATQVLCCCCSALLLSAVCPLLLGPVTGALQPPAGWGRSELAASVALSPHSVLSRFVLASVLVCDPWQSRVAASPTF